MDEEHIQKALLQPSNLDVLFGRDGPSIKHVGNVTLRTVVGLSFPEYKALAEGQRWLKNKFLNDVVGCIVTSGGRFLRCTADDRNNWEEVDTADARVKVGQQFRDVKKDPCVLERSSLLNSLQVTAHFKAAGDFDWPAMVAASKQELQGSHQQENVGTPPMGAPEVAEFDIKFLQLLKDTDLTASKGDSVAMLGVCFSHSKSFLLSDQSALGADGLHVRDSVNMLDVSLPHSTNSSLSDLSAFSSDGLHTRNSANVLDVSLSL